MKHTLLFVESNFQMNGSNLRIDELVDQAVTLGYGALALTDDRLYGLYKFHQACRSRGIKPILGMQITVEGLQEGHTNRLLLYAQNREGYTHLLRLASIHSHRLVTLADWKRYNQGLIAVVLTDQSELKPAIRNQNERLIQEFFHMMQEHAPRYFCGLSEDDDINQYLVQRTELVAVPRIGMLHAEDRDVYEVLGRIFNRSEDSLLSDGTVHHVLSFNEMQDLYQGYPDALSNTGRIAAMCDVSIETGSAVLPSYPVPNDASSRDYLRALVYKGLEKRLQQTPNNPNRYHERLEHELAVIDSMGYNDYFLIVWDFVKYAKQQGYLVGPGRGSAAASLVSYCLGITSVDSIAFDLVFERFLNPERITMPDIDMDLPDDKRDDVIRYVTNKYGHDRVSSICTFGTFQMKSAIRDTARILGVEGVLLNEIMGHVKGVESVRELIERDASIQNIMRKNPLADRTIRTAAKIEGLHRHVSTHAAGIILTEDELMRHTAVQPGLLDMFQTQYEAKDLEDLGLLKIDFLGLRNLTAIDRIVDLIERREGKRIDVYRIPLDDEPTFALLRRVETTGLFQLESQGMRRLIGDMQMRSFDDIVTCLALFRPGPMDSIPTYLKRRFHKEDVTYPHPILEEILEPTSGIIIYQEQIIQIAASFAGYSMGEADLLRRAVSKKQEDVLQQERQHFLTKSLAMGRDEVTSEAIYDYIVKFANYGFNKAHSVAYAMVSYWMAYLKANYPKYFISVLTTSVIGSEHSLREYLLEATKLGVSIRPPSIQRSTHIFEPEGDALRYPLLGIKYVGVNAVDEILSEREQGPFTSFVDAVKRLNKRVNKRVLEALIQAGAMDEFGHTKHTMINQLENVIQFTQLGEFIADNEFVLHPMPEYSYTELEAMERSAIGFNLFVNPLLEYQSYIDKHHLLTASDLEEQPLKSEVRMVGMVSRIRTIQTKRKQPMAFITVADAFTQITGVLFPRIYTTYEALLHEGEVYLIKGTVDERNQEKQMVLTHLHRLSGETHTS
jgi:DNA polymerase-3 subunit alpha